MYYNEKSKLLTYIVCSYGEWWQVLAMIVDSLSMKVWDWLWTHCHIAIGNRQPPVEYSTQSMAKYLAIVLYVVLCPTGHPSDPLCGVNETILPTTACLYPLDN